MKKSRFSLLVLITIALVLTLAVTSCAGDVEEEPQDQNDKNPQSKNENNDEAEEKNIEEIAVAFVNDLLEEKYDDAYENYSFTSQMQKAVNPTVLEQAMGQLNQAVGDFITITETKEAKKSPYDIIGVICEFDKKYMSLNVVFDQDKKIAGFNFTEPQGYSKTSEGSDIDIPDNIKELEVVVGEGAWALPGTLALPEGEGPFPAVVLVHGSGPNDRDETIGPNKPFRDIAWGLASKGIAVLRYEKRTKEYGQEVANNINEFTVKEETIDDALSAVELLREHEAIDNDNIHVLGHSLGGYLVPQIGVNDEEIAGFIILGGATRPLEDLMVEQYEYLSSLDGNVTDDEQKQIDSVKAARDMIKELKPNGSTNQTALLGAGAQYWIDLQDYRPVEMAKDLDRPILILQGERDYQVTMEDFENWKDGLSDEGDATFKSFEKLNHLFMQGEGTPNPNEYYLENKVSQDVIDYISQWVNNH